MDTAAILSQLEALGEAGVRKLAVRTGAGKRQYGEQIGLYRDWPVSKGCTSPFAPSWISEMVRRQG